MNAAQVTVIVPTTAQHARFGAIRRCIGSVRASSAQPVAIIAVVNGARSDPAVRAWLQRQPDIRYEYVAAPSAPNAVLHGRGLVATPFFSTLDDDDEYLPGATDLKLAALHADAAADLVVTNAYQCQDGAEALMYSHLHAVPADPLHTLFEANWLHNGNALYRSAAIGAAYFRDFRPYAEWTWLAYRLALDGRKVATLEQPTFRYHITPGSLSQSEAYFDSYLPLFERMLERAPPKEVAYLIRCKMGASWHHRSARALHERKWRRAVSSHLRSLLLPEGGKYLGYSRHLVTRWLFP
jgi:hypothetical protein